MKYMAPVEQRCERTAEITQKLSMNFGDRNARVHLAECLSCRNVLAGTGNHQIQDLARTIRDGIACSG